MAWNFGLLGASSGVANDFDLLETTILGSTTTSVTFSSLDSYTDYKDLQLRISARFNDTGNVIDTYLRFNSDTGSNYAFHYLQGFGGSVSSSGSSSQTSTRGGDAAGNAVSNAFGSEIIDILDFSNPSKYTTVRSFGGAIGSDSGRTKITSGLWMNTNPVTSITYSQYNKGTPTMEIGSRISLYGIKG